MAILVIAEHDSRELKAATLHTVTAATACDGDVHVLEIASALVLVYQMQLPAQALGPFHRLDGVGPHQRIELALRHLGSPPGNRSAFGVRLI